MADAYETTGGGLRLKGKANKLIKKKKKKKGKCDEIVHHATNVEDTAEASKGTNDSDSEEAQESKTPAERAFERAQNKRSAERILKKASKSHKQRVEELNVYLDGLSEHYDIQKVSWTK